jgi:hypothetical protein
MRRRFVMSVVALLPVVAGTSFVAILGLCAVRSWVHVPDDNDTVGNYLQTVGTIYAVLLAFVTSTVWSQFNETREVIDHEANEVIDLYLTTDGFPEAERIALQQSLARYVDRVIAEEWPAMARVDDRTSETVGDELDEVWAKLHVFEPRTECSKSLHAEALSRYNDLSDARTHRLTAARTRIPFPMKLLIYVGAAIVILSMYLFVVPSFAIHAIMTGSVAGAVSHILYLVWDLDNPFAGSWTVSPEPFERVRRYMRRREAERLAEVSAP